MPRTRVDHSRSAATQLFSWHKHRKPDITVKKDNNCYYVIPTSEYHHSCAGCNIKIVQAKMSSTHRQQHHYLPLDSVRGVAALSVVVHHVILMPPFLAAFPQKAWFDWAYFHNAWLLVDLFFVLSGIVISMSYTNTDFGKFSFGEFIVRRLARVYPLHIVILVALLGFRLVRIGLVAAGAIPPAPATFQVNNAYSFVLNLFLLHSLGFIDYLSWNGPSWSISVEFYTYILFAFMLIVAERLNTLRFLYWCAILLVISNWLIIVFVLQKPDLGLQYDHGFLRCVLSFFLGVLTVKAVSAIPRTIPASLQSGVQIGSMFISFLLVSIEGAYPAVSFVAPIVFATFLGSLLAFPAAWGLPRLLQTAPLVWLGSRSYSLYMTHALVILLAEYAVRAVGPRAIESLDSISTGLAATLTFSAVIAAVIALSSLTYRYVEIPGSRLLRGLVLQTRSGFSTAFADNPSRGAG
jgi:peptidoglycan/LPS O-acetylase OafA/YrhL